MPAADGDGRWRVDAQGARSFVLTRHRVLWRASADGGERRRPGYRRLRTAGLLAERPAQSVDRSPRKSNRLLNIEDGPEIRTAVPRAGGLRHEHPPVRVGRRGVPASYSLQNSG